MGPSGDTDALDRHLLAYGVIPQTREYSTNSASRGSQPSDEHVSSIRKPVIYLGREVLRQGH